MADKPKHGYQFIDPTGHSYNVRKVKGVRSRVYATGKVVQAPRPSGVTNKPTTSRPPAGNASGAKLPVARFKGWSPEHQRQALKFYGGDALTPADFFALKPAQQRDIMERVRTGAHAAQAPESVSRPQTLQDVYKGAEQAAGLKYGETQREIGVDQKASDIQQGNISGWFNEYQRTIRDAAERTKALYQGAVDADAATAATSQAQAAAAQAPIQQGAQADAAARGAVVDPQLAAEAAQAAASRQASADALIGTTRQQGAITGAYQQNLRGVAANQGVQAHLAEAATKKNLARKLRDLLTEKGQYEQTTRQDLIAAERKNRLETAAFNLDVTQEQNDQAAAAGKTQADKDKEANTVITSGAFAGFTNKQVRAMSADRKASLRRAAAAGKKGSASDTTKYFGYTKKEFDAMTPDERRQAKSKWDAAGRAPGKGKDDKPSSGPGSVTPDKEQDRVSQILRVRSLISKPPKWPSGPRKGQRMSTADVINSLKQGGVLSPHGPLDPRVVDVAGNLVANKGKLGPYGKKVAHQLGIHINAQGW